jgi:hypothetical protein
MWTRQKEEYSLKVLPFQKSKWYLHYRMAPIATYIARVWGFSEKLPSRSADKSILLARPGKYLNVARCPSYIPPTNYSCVSMS